jgi:hypothetical protein
MTENKISDTYIIPPRSEERPVRSLGDFVFANDAWHCRPVHLWPRGIKDMLEEWREPIERYLAAFCEPVTTAAKEVCCVACNEQVTGHHVGLDHWKFKQKLTYSPEGTREGRCTTCGYPCRLLHRIVSLDGQHLLVELSDFPLFYHPSATQQTN